MPEKFKSWLISSNSNWFILGYFLDDFIVQVMRANAIAAGAALVVILFNIWVLRQKY